MKKSPYLTQTVFLADLESFIQTETITFLYKELPVWLEHTGRSFYLPKKFFEIITQRYKEEPTNTHRKMAILLLKQLISQQRCKIIHFPETQDVEEDFLKLLLQLSKKMVVSVLTPSLTKAKQIYLHQQSLENPTDDPMPIIQWIRLLPTGQLDLWYVELQVGIDSIKDSSNLSVHEHNIIQRFQQTLLDQPKLATFFLSQPALFEQVIRQVSNLAPWINYPNLYQDLLRDPIIIPHLVKYPQFLVDLTQKIDWTTFIQTIKELEETLLQIEHIQSRVR